MTPRMQRQRAGVVLIVAFLVLATGLARAVPPQAVPPATLLARADQLRTSDHSRFLQLLKQLHQDRDRLSPAQQKRLRYLDAWQTAYTGDYDQAHRILTDLIKHADNASLSARAEALLLHIMFVQRHYEQAYTMVNPLIEALPDISNAEARRSVLAQIIQILIRVKQYDLALKYIHRMQHDFSSGKSHCLADFLKTQILRNQDELESTSPEFRKTVDACRAANEPVYANALSLDWADLMQKEGHPDRAIALLHRITPDIMNAGYQFHIASLHVILARSYLARGDDTLARNSALAAIAANDPESFNWTLEYAYKVLYQVAHEAGHDGTALAYLEQYLAQYKAATRDAKTQALAYQMVRQKVLAKQLELEKLSKQNKVLQLQQSLNRKAVVNNRLYVVVLLLVLAFIGFWAYRTKHSQMRFRRMAEHDDLTGCLTRRHFLELAEQRLRCMGKTRTQACFLILDIDHFKRINDAHGHMNGDRVLEHTAAICRKELRTADLFGRLGGEEFGILIPDCSCEQGTVIGRRICHALAVTPASLDGDDRVPVTVSVGLASTDRAGWSLRQLLIRADEALYVAKRDGRNRLFVHADGADVTGTDTPA